MNHSDSCPSCGLLWGYDGAADSVLTCDGITYGCPCGARFPVSDFEVSVTAYEVEGSSPTAAWRTTAYRVVRRLKERG